jgi:hypothetical protein
MLQAAPAPNGIPPRPDLAVESFDDATACRDACDTVPDSAAVPQAEALSEAMAGSAVNLPLQLLDALLASPVVPREAKLAAIDAWRRELAEAQLREPSLGALHDRLCSARRLIARMGPAQIMPTRR